METVIQAVDRDLIKRELTPDKFMGQTRKGNNLIFEVMSIVSQFPFYVR